MSGEKIYNKDYIFLKKERQMEREGSCQRKSVAVRVLWRNRTNERYIHLSYTCKEID